MRSVHCDFCNAVLTEHALIATDPATIEEPR